jgi:hypothetical protein
MSTSVATPWTRESAASVRMHCYHLHDRTPASDCMTQPTNALRHPPLNAMPALRVADRTPV